ncbi:MAG: hypothetical protein J1E34_03195 [Oscillospiraceae bacterium]|nr:hypothetical protein [Oscillospiraceae bacterium]
MSTVYLNSTSLNERVEELENLNEQLLAEIGTLNDNEAALAGMWEGPAKEAFRQAYASDSVQMKNFYNAIRVYIQVLRIILCNYRNTECQNENMARTRTYG